MKVSTHPDRRRITAQEVCIVLDHSRTLTQQAWAEFFGISLATVQAWRRQGFFLGLWSAPTAEQWNSLKADALKNLRGIISVITGNRRQ